MWRACRALERQQISTTGNSPKGIAAARLSNERFGKTRVLQDLRHRRVAPAWAERRALGYYQDWNESALIEEWIRRKYRATPREGLFQEDKDLASAYAGLFEGGFPYGGDRPGAEKFAKNPELLET